MIQTLLSIAYAPPVQYFAKLLKGDCTIEQHENFQKRTYRNRCYIATPTGPEALAIPIEGGGAQRHTPIREVRISSHNNWQDKHWSALCTHYRATPFFEYYAPELEPFFLPNPPGNGFLFDYNWELILLLIKMLGITQLPTLSTEFNPPAQSNLTALLQPHSEWQDPHFVPKPYYQPYRTQAEFLPNCSVLDLLFNLGPEALLHLARCVN